MLCVIIIYYDKKIKSFVEICCKNLGTVFFKNSAAFYYFKKSLITIAK